MPSILQGRNRPAPVPAPPADDQMQPGPMPDEGAPQGGSRVTLSKNPDGSYNVEHEDGNVTTEPNIGTALSAAATSCGEDPQAAAQMMSSPRDESDWGGEEMPEKESSSEGKDYE